MKTSLHALLLVGLLMTVASIVQEDPKVSMCGLVLVGVAVVALEEKPA